MFFSKVNLMKTGVIVSVEKMLLLLLLESSLLLLTLLLSLSLLISLVRKSTDDCNHSCQRKWFLKLDLVYCDVVTSLKINKVRVFCYAVF